MPVRVLACCCALGGFLVGAAPHALSAQTTVTGVVQDSIVRRPLAGATVQLVPDGVPGAAPRGVEADSTGAFRFANVAPGRYLLGFVSERLDSLGIEAPVRTITVAPGATELRTDLWVPSARTIAAAVCGERRDSTGVLLGRVLDAGSGDAVATGSVVVRWGELRVDATGLHHLTPSVRAPVGTDGRYAVCGVPLNLIVIVQANAGPDTRPTARSGTIDLLVPLATPLLHRDLLVAAVADPTPDTVAADRGARIAPASRGTARLAGHVRRPNGSPLPGARVVVHGAGAADSTAVTDSAGTFRLDALPGGTYPVEAIAIGFTPARGAVDLRPDRVAAVDLAVGARVSALQSVNVYASRSRAGSEFAERAKRSGFGRFLMGDQIERSGARSIGDALVMVPGLRIGGVSAVGHTQILGRGRCTPEVYLDGFRVDSGSTYIDDLVTPQEVGGIEVYADAMTAPVQYSRGACASIVIWTKGALR